MATSVFVPRPMPPKLAERVEKDPNVLWYIRNFSMAGVDVLGVVLSNLVSILERLGKGRTEIEIYEGTFRTLRQIASSYRKDKRKALSIIAGAPDLGGLEAMNPLLAEAMEPLFQQWWRRFSENSDYANPDNVWNYLHKFFSEDQESWVNLQTCKPLLEKAADEDWIGRLVEDEGLVAFAKKCVSGMKYAVSIIEDDLIVGSSAKKNVWAVINAAYQTQNDARYISDNVIGAPDTTLATVYFSFLRRALYMVSSVCSSYSNEQRVRDLSDQMQNVIQYSEYDPSGEGAREVTRRMMGQVYVQILNPTLLTMSASSGFVSTSSTVSTVVGALLGAAAYRFLAK